MSRRSLQHIGIFLLCATAVVVLSYARLPAQPHAGLRIVHAQSLSSGAIEGWAWSDNIGWICFGPNPTPSDTTSCPHSQVNITNGVLSGYAWADGVGWISFNDGNTVHGGTNDLVACPSGACQADYHSTTGALSGWARACEGTLPPGCGTQSSPQQVIYLTSSTAPSPYSCGSNCFTVPSDWNSANNTVEVIGGGGGGPGAAGGSFSGGGGGGAYSKTTNVSLTPGTQVMYQVGAGGSGGGASTNGSGGTDTYFCEDSSGNCSDSGSFGTSVVAGAKAGVGGQTNGTGGNGGSASSGVGSIKYSGGAGGTQTIYSGGGGSGGGGAAGPLGNGGAGASMGTYQPSGGGGGGSSGGGSSGATGLSSGAGGNGGNNASSAGGGAGGANGVNGTAGTSGGGGGGGGGCFQCTAGAGGAGGAGTDWSASYGAGGGGGGGSQEQGGGGPGAGAGGSGGNYGGGGGGGGWGNGGVSLTSGGSGTPGLIVVKYVPVSGWDGWISLSCQNDNSCNTVSYGPTISGGGSAFTDWAWDSGLLGWIDFTPGLTSTASCTLSSGSFPASINAGQSTSFQYTLSNAASSYVAGTVGADTAQQAPTSTPTITVNPVASDSYTMYVSGTSGPQNSCGPVSVTVVQPPTCSLTNGTAQPGSGYGANLTYTTTGVPTGVGMKENGVSISDLPSPVDTGGIGKLYTTPTFSTPGTYNFVATVSNNAGSGSCGNGSSQGVVTVSYPPGSLGAGSAAFAAAPSRVRKNGTTYLTWTTTNENSCTVKDQKGNSIAVPSPSTNSSGTQTPVTGITADTVYTLTCTDASNNSLSQSATVSLVPSYQEI